MYQLILSSSAKQELGQVDKRYHSAIAKAFKRLQGNPRVGKPLIGHLKGFWKLRFSRYRIIYRIEESTVTVLVVAIGHRRDVYRDF